MTNAPPKSSPSWTRVAWDWASLVTPWSESAVAITTAAGIPAETSVVVAAIHAPESAIHAITTTTAITTPPRE